MVIYNSQSVALFVVCFIDFARELFATEGQITVSNFDDYKFGCNQNELYVKIEAFMKES